MPLSFISIMKQWPQWHKPSWCLFICFSWILLSIVSIDAFWTAIITFAINILLSNLIIDSLKLDYKLTFFFLLVVSAVKSIIVASSSTHFLWRSLLYKTKGPIMSKFYVKLQFFFFFIHNLPIWIMWYTITTIYTYNNTNNILKILLRSECVDLLTVQHNNVA